MKVSLISRFPLASAGRRRRAEFVLNPGETTTFILRQVEDGRPADLLEARLVGEEALTQTCPSGGTG